MIAAATRSDCLTAALALQHCQPLLLTGAVAALLGDRSGLHTFGTLVLRGREGAVQGRACMRREGGDGIRRAGTTGWSFNPRGGGLNCPRPVTPPPGRWGAAGSYHSTTPGAEGQKL